MGNLVGQLNKFQFHCFVTTHFLLNVSWLSRPVHVINALHSVCLWAFEFNCCDCCCVGSQELSQTHAVLRNYDALMQSVATCKYSVNECCMSIGGTGWSSRVAGDHFSLFQSYTLPYKAYMNDMCVPPRAASKSRPAGTILNCFHGDQRPVVDTRRQSVHPSVRPYSLSSPVSDIGVQGSE
jgi:hypothetical protein